MFLEAKVLFNTPEWSKKDGANIPTATLTISIDNPMTTNRQLKSIIYKINETFSSCDFVVCDTLNRYNIMMKDSSISEKEAKELAYKEGDLWLKKNQAALDSITIKHNIIRWDNWLNHPNFKSKLKIIESEYINNQNYKEGIDNTAITYLKRRSFDKDKNINLCIKYLQEECAVMLLWADKAYDFELYPSKRNQAMERTHEILLQRNDQKEKLLPIKIDVKYKRKEEKEIALIAFNQLIKLTHGHVYVKDEDGHYLYCNEAQAKSLGLQAEEIIGKTDFDLSEKEVAEKYRQSDIEIMQSGEVKILEEEAFYNDEHLIFLSTKAPLLGSHGEIIGLLGISLDITAQKEAKLLREQVAQHKAIEAKNKLFKDFTGELTRLINKFQVLSDRGETELNMDDEGTIKLTKRETEVLYLLSRGKKPKDIASKLDISPKTAQNIVDGKLFPKFGTNNISSLLEKARVLNLIPFSLEI